MKKLIYVAVLLALPFITLAQIKYSGNDDQNSRYRESQERYSKMTDSLVQWHGMTLQQTYKAYDWYEARQARRQQRREWRHERIMTHGYNNGFYYNGYYPYGYDNYRYNNYYPSINYGQPWNGWSVGVGFGW